MLRMKIRHSLMFQFQECNIKIKVFNQEVINANTTEL